MEHSREDFETLRLLRAFGKIQDPQKRREIIELACHGSKSPAPIDEEAQLAAAGGARQATAAVTRKCAGLRSRANC
jgi:hypothetical protein